jgi:hypothetical protein
MCLNCGNYYCNYCFIPFPEACKAHTHVANHSTSNMPENRDAFLSSEVVAVGQKQHQVIQLEKCISSALSALEFDSGNEHNVALVLIMCHYEINFLDIDLLQLWMSARAIHITNQDDNTLRLTCDMTTESSAFSVSTDHPNETEIDDIESPSIVEESGTPTIDTIRPPFEGLEEHFRLSAECIQLQRLQRQGGVQLANALITNNSEAITQIMHMYRGNSLDVNFIDHKHGNPLCSLAILAGCTEVFVT